jgi:hypothetical protein
MDNLKESLTGLKNMLSDAMITQIDLDLKIKLICKLNEALRIHDVVGRRELLIAYELKLWINPTQEQIEIAEKVVDMYLRN